MNDSEKFERIKQVIELAEDCSQKQLMTESEIAISSLRSVRRIINRKNSFKVYDVLGPKPGFILHNGCDIHNFAVVAQINPLIIMSHCGEKIWLNQDENNFIKISNSDHFDIELAKEKIKKVYL